MFQKHRGDGSKRDANARSNSPQESFVRNFRSSSRDNNSDRTDYRPTEHTPRYRSCCTSRHSYTKKIPLHHNTRIVVFLETATSMNETIRLHDTPGLDLTITEDILAQIAHLPKEHLLDVILVLFKDHVLFQEINQFNKTLLLIDLSLDKENQGTLDRHHILKMNTVNNIQQKPTILF